MGAESIGKKSIQNPSQAAPALEQRYLPLDTSFAEKHYRDSDLAKLWALGKGTVRKLVKDDPDVIRTAVPPKLPRERGAQTLNCTTALRQAGRSRV